MESNRWLIVAFLAGGLLIGAAAYTAGVSQGAAHALASSPSSTGAAERPDRDAFDADWGWRWGWGHHMYWGFPFGPILAIFFWVWIIRALFWGFHRPWGWRRRWRYYDPYYDDPRSYDEWRRRDRERNSPPPPPSQL